MSPPRGIYEIASKFVRRTKSVTVNIPTRARFWLERGSSTPSHVGADAFVRPASEASAHAQA